MTDIVMQDATSADAIVHLAATGDEAAFARLVAQHHASMARVAYVICGDAEVTRDAVQSAWTVAWQRLGDVKDPTRVRAWLVAIAANEARQAMRRQRRVMVVDLSTVIDEPGSGGDPADGIAVVDLARVLRGLKPEDRELLALRFVAGLDSAEIAVQLGGSASGVRSRLARLIERLRDDLDAREGSR
jgi:RNA polymerase sigma-70 factor, ECF subfamily